LSGRRRGWRGGWFGTVLWPGQGELGRECASDIRGKDVGSLKLLENRVSMKDFDGGEIVKVNGGKLIKF